LSNTMRDLLSNPQRLRRMGQAGRQRAERLLTWDHSAEHLERVYLNLVNESEPRLREPLTPEGSGTGARSASAP
jgi:hypothetical protein